MPSETMEEEGATTPFWLPPSSGHRRRRGRRSPSSVFLSSSFLIIFLPLVALLFVVFVLPPIVSFTSVVFRPNMVKKSWDSLNLVLVLFAIICGFLSRGGGGGGGSSDAESSVLEAPVESTERSNRGNWYEERSGHGGMRRLKSSSSYPDLRQESALAGSDWQWRSYDDSQLINRGRVSDRQFYVRRRYDDQDYGEVKNIDVDNTSVISPKEKVLSHVPPRSPSQPPPPSPPPAPPPPPPVVRRKVKRSFQAVAREEKKRETTENIGFESGRVRDSAPAPPPPPPPPPPLTVRKSEKTDRKRGGATKEFLTSLYYQRNKKKKQRQKSVENLDAILHDSPPSDQPLRPLPSPPPPPPPPPPPNSVFHNLFSSKKGKSKRFLTVPPPPPPPPPPSKAYAGNKAKTNIALSQSHPYDHPLTASKPLVPEKSSSFNSVDDNPYAGSESPLIPIPPPPPPPPFKMPDWKFVVQGDYVRIKSTNSSRSGSPDLDYIGSPSNKGPSRSTSLKSETDGGDPTPPLFCPSPDVNTKADTFIARFRAGLKLEKINSIKEKQEVGLSNLGPEPGQGQGSRAVQI